MTSQRVHFLIPGSLERRSGGTIYDARIVAALRELGHDVVVYELDGRFPAADAIARTATRQVLARVRPGEVVVVDGLALPALDLSAWPMAATCVPLLHTPVGEMRGPSEVDRAPLIARETAWLHRADRIVVTSVYSAERLVGRGVDARRIGVVEPGIDPVTSTPDGAGVAEVRILAVGAVTAVKAHDVLVRALGRLRHLPWRLRIIGSTDEEPGTSRALMDEIERLELGDRVELSGELSPHEMPGAYRAADVFVHSSLYESYCLALAEAAAHGLALVATTAGAIPTTPAGRAAVCVPPGDAETLARALEPVLRDADTRRRLAIAAREAAERLPTWEEAGRRFADELSGSSEATWARTRAAAGPEIGETARVAVFERMAGEWDALEDPRTELGADATARVDFLRTLCTAGARVLEVGCGTGVNLVGLADRIDSGVGVDFAPAMIDRAREAARRCGVDNLRFVVGDARSLDSVPDASGPFDLVLLAGVLEHIPERGRVLRACRERLATGGTLVVIMPHPANPTFMWRRLVTGRPPRIFVSDLHMRPNELARLARAHGLDRVRVHPLPFRSTFDDDPPRPVWLGRILRGLDRIPASATRGAFALVLKRVD